MQFELLLDKLGPMENEWPEGTKLELYQSYYPKNSEKVYKKTLVEYCRKLRRYNNFL